MGVREKIRHVKKIKGRRRVREFERPRIMSGAADKDSPYRRVEGRYREKKKGGYEKPMPKGRTVWKLMGTKHGREHRRSVDDGTRTSTTMQYK